MGAADGMKLLVCGGRYYANRELVFATLDRIDKQRGVKILIEGGANGADALARQWARRRGVICATVPAVWAKRGRAAGPIRNAAMLTLGPDGVLAFPGGSGTENMKQLARDAGVTVMEVADVGS